MKTHHEKLASDVYTMPSEDVNMEWTTPQFEEVALNCEINSYASAAL